jgi:hypothetical protein
MHYPTQTSPAAKGYTLRWVVYIPEECVPGEVLDSPVVACQPWLHILDFLQLQKE